MSHLNAALKIILLVCFVFLTGCSRLTQEQREAAAVAAAFRRLAHDYPTMQNYTIKTWFLARTGEFKMADGLAGMFRNPPAEWIGALKESRPPVRPISAARIANNPEGMSDGLGEHAVAAFVIHKISWRSKSSVLIEAEVCGRAYVGGGFRILVDYKGGAWEAVEIKLTYVT